MAGKREEKKQAVRQAIYDAATNLFEAEGYDAVSVGRITSEVGIAKGTFFNHYPSKADILADWYRTLVDKAMAPPEASLPLLERLLELVRRTHEEMSSRAELWRAKSVEAPKTPSLGVVEKEADQAFITAVRRELQRSDLPDGLPAHEVIADLLLAIATGTWRELLVTDRLSESEALFRARFGAFLRAIGACQGE